MSAPGRILIDLTHPAHVHFFRNLVVRLEDEGHEVLLTGRDKDITVDLASRYGLDVDVFGEAGQGVLGLGAEMLYRQSRLLRIVRRFRPTAMLAIAGTFIAAVGWATRTPTYVFYDTEHATLSNLLAYPFATCVYVPKAYYKTIRWRHERYAGYHELAYLHPSCFEPDPTVLEEVGLVPGEPFSIVRFIGWGAAHDIGLEQFGGAEKMRAVEALSAHSRVLISAEGDLPAELEPLRLDLDVHRMHDLMSFASLVFGDSGTMPSEAAILGTPGIRVHPEPLGYLQEQERDYGIVFNFKPPHIADAIDRAEVILEADDKEHWRRTAARIHADKIDVNDFLFGVATERPYR